MALWEERSARGGLSLSVQPLHVLQKILGHQSLETTRKYLHADHRHLASAAKQANAFLANWSPSGPPSSQRRTQSVKQEGGPTF